MKMKENRWAIRKPDSEAFDRQAEQKELKNKQHLQGELEHQEEEQQQQERWVQQQYPPLPELKYYTNNNQIGEQPQQESKKLDDDQLNCKKAQVKEQVMNESDDDDDGELNKDDDETLKNLEKCLRSKEVSEKSFAKQQVRDRSQIKSRRPKQTKKDDSSVNLSFCGCGFLGIYHVGVTSCFHEYAPQLSRHKISGSSAGALVAVAHICGNLSLAYCTTDILTVAIEARSHTLGPFHPSFDVQASVREALERGLPEDAYIKANGKLHVSLTRVEDGENVIVNEFASNEDLIQVLLCSCFIPFWSGLRLPKYKGVTYIDGGFSDNLLILDDKTVTVSPFSGEADICPQDDTLNLLQVSLSHTSFSLSPNNLYRLSHALLPPAPEVLSDLFEQGFADGIKYLQRMNLISCTKCLEIRSSLLVTTNGEDMEEVITMNNNELNESLKNGVSSETSSLHHIILEQQEQKMIEINRNSRRSSFVSTTNQVYPQQQSDLTPPISIHNLLNGIDDDGLEVDCCECTLIRQKALYGPMPKQFSDRIREACDTVNKSLYNWIYSHRPVKYFSYLMVPYYLPIDITLALVYKCWKRLPTMRSELIDRIYHIVNFIIRILKPIQARSTSSILMETDSSWANDVIAHEKELVKQQESAQVHHHHYHHYNSNNTTTTPSNQAVPKTRKKPVSSNSMLKNQNQPLNNQPRELHSLEDNFDSIVDVTSKQEARIFAYYFRDAKNRLQVTEIFDLERAAELNNSNSNSNYRHSKSHNTPQVPLKLSPD